MAANFVIVPIALDDIDALTDWMHQTDSTSDFDLRFIDVVYDAFGLLAANPGAGHKRADLTDQPVLQQHPNRIWRNWISLITSGRR